MATPPHLDASPFMADRLAPRLRPPIAVVIHTTGRTIAVRARADAHTDHADSVDLAVVRRILRDGNTLGATWLIGRAARLWRLAPDDRIIHHALSLGHRYDERAWREWAWPHGGGLARHGRDPDRVWDWWDLRWDTLATPLAFPAGRCPNETALSVDLVPQADGSFSEPQHEVLAGLLEHICANHPIPRTRWYVLGHEDVDPQRRGAVLGSRNTVFGRPWDPGRGLLWSRLGLES